MSNDFFPLINFSDSDLRPGTAKWDLVRSQVRKAAEDYGCFQAHFNIYPEDLKNAVNEQLEQVFELPSEIKKKNVSERPFHGYMGSSSPTSPYESLGIFESDVFDQVKSFTSLLWPQGNTKFCKSVHSLAVEVGALDKMIRRMIMESLGVEKYIEEHLNSTINFLRVAKYQAPNTSETREGLRAHTDKNILTIFYQNQVDGLEIQTKNGDWVPIKFSPHSLFVLIGECLNALVNGRLYSPYHRVMMKGDNTRYSALFFSMPKEGYVIKAFEELVDEHHPLLFKPFDYTDYLNRRFADNANFITVPPLKKYFGA